MVGPSNAREGWESPANNSGKTTIGLYVYVDDVDTHFERAKATGAKLITELKNHFYGDRNYEVQGLECHRWTFGKDIK